MRVLFIFLVSLVATMAQAQRILDYKPVSAEFASHRISKTALAQDMVYWQQQMEKTHVDIYHAICKKEMIALRQQLLAALPYSVTHFQASFAISELIGALGEGHLGLASSPVIDSMYSYHAQRFPFLIEDITDQGWTVQRDLSGENKLAPQSVILSVNGIPAAELFARYQKYYGGLPDWKKIGVKNDIRKLLYMDEIRSPFTIKALQNGDTTGFTVNGFNRKQADSINKSLRLNLASREAFSLLFLENNIALIEFNDMDGLLRDSFSVFLRKSFTLIREKNATGVIIDIRKNGGGDSELGDELISYISDKPYRNTAGMKIRISEPFQRISRMRGNDVFEKWKPGKVYVIEAASPKPARENALRYGGKVCLLIGPATFSSANMLTNAIKDFQLATLVGEPTAEPGNDYGEIFSFMLPKTRIVASTAVKMFIRANGDEKNNEGIKPDIHIKNSADAVQAGRDEVLEKAISFIRG